MEVFFPPSHKIWVGTCLVDRAMLKWAAQSKNPTGLLAQPCRNIQTSPHKELRHSGMAGHCVAMGHTPFQVLQYVLSHGKTGIPWSHNIWILDYLPNKSLPSSL